MAIDAVSHRRSESVLAPTLPPPAPPALQLTNKALPQASAGLLWAGVTDRPVEEFLLGTHTENRCSVRAMLRGRLISTFYSVSDRSLARPHRDNASRRLAFGAEAGVTHSHTWVLIESTRYRGGQRRKYHPAWEGSEREQGLEFLDTSPSGRQSPCPLCMTLD